MGTLRHILIASAIIGAGMIFSHVSGAVAGDFETCREVQSRNVHTFNQCLDRYNLPRVSRRDFNHIIGGGHYQERRYRDRNGWFQREEPRRYSHYRHRERRYIGDYEYSPNHDGTGLIIQFGQLTVIFK